MGFTKSGCAVALGAFDGVHTGHTAVLKNAVDSGYTPVAVSFSSPTKSAGFITSEKEKYDDLKELGFKEVKLLDFGSVKDIPPQDFLQKLLAAYDVKMICCGFDYRFGKGAAGNVETLGRYCAENGIELSVTPPVTAYGEIVSSTEIRKMIENGEVEKANTLTLKPFGFSGEVIHGDARGRTIGFPTVNQPLPVGMVSPKFGVYASRIMFDGETYNSVTNIGIRPTFLLNTPIAETYIGDFSGDVYGKTVRLELLRFIRPEKKFSSLQELKDAIEHDKDSCLK